MSENQSTPSVASTAKDAGLLADEREAQEPLVSRLFKRKVIFWIVAVFVLALDLISKEWAQAKLTVQDPTVYEGGTRVYYNPELPENGIEWMKGVLHFKWAENFGAAFSIGSGNTLLLAFISMGVLGIIFYYLARMPSRRRFAILCLALVTGGALGNLWDRLTYKTIDTQRFVETSNGFETNKRYGQQVTAVRDFLYWPFDIPIFSTWGLDEEHLQKYGTRKWPIFNVADMGIVGGVCGLVAFFIFVPDPKRRRKEEASPAKSGANSGANPGPSQQPMPSGIMSSADGSTDMTLWSSGKPDKGKPTTGKVDTGTQNDEPRGGVGPKA